MESNWQQTGALSTQTHCLAIIMLRHTTK